MTQHTHTRVPLLAGNWKMNTTLNKGGELVGKILEGLEGLGKSDGGRMVEVAVLPPFTHLHALAQVVGQHNRQDWSEESNDGGAAQGGQADVRPFVALGAQDVSAQASGAYTGEVSGEMLAGVGCTYVLVGHSERRQYHGESDALCAAKVNAALQAGLRPILCVGETLEQRDGGQLAEVLTRQLTQGGLHVASEQWHKVVLAYEPVWAIGTGRTASPAQAQEAHALLRGLVAGRYGEEAAGTTRILYGGSMKPDNAAALLAEADIDGGLIGGASLDAGSFLGICRAAAGV